MCNFLQAQRNQISEYIFRHFLTASIYMRHVSARLYCMLSEPTINLYYSLSAQNFYSAVTCEITDKFLGSRISSEVEYQAG